MCKEKLSVVSEKCPDFSILTLQGQGFRGSQKFCHIKLEYPEQPGLIDLLSFLVPAQEVSGHCPDFSIMKLILN